MLNSKFQLSLWTNYIHKCSIISVLFQMSHNPDNSVQFSRSVVSDSLRPHELRHARPPCPSPTPGVHSNSCPLSPWCHPAISSSVVPFSPAPNPSQHQGLFQWVNYSHEVSKVLEFKLQHQSFQWNSGLISFRTDWFYLLAVQGTLKSLLQHHN